MTSTAQSQPAEDCRIELPKTSPHNTVELNMLRMLSFTVTLWNRIIVMAAAQSQPAIFFTGRLFYFS